MYLDFHTNTIFGQKGNEVNRSHYLRKSYIRTYNNTIYNCELPQGVNFKYLSLYTTCGFRR